MYEHHSVEIDPRLLVNPEHGRAYLKAALEIGDEREFLSALHAVMDSVIDAEYAPDSEVRVLPTWENAKAA